MQGQIEIARGDDLEGLIRQNELLRLHNKRLLQLVATLITNTIHTIQEHLPSLPAFPLPPSPQLSATTTTLPLHLHQHLPVCLQALQDKGSLKAGRKAILQLQAKVQDYCSTINEMTLIIQKLQIEVQEHKMEKETVLRTMQQLRLERDSERREKQRWQHRCHYLSQALEEHRGIPISFE